MKIVIVLVIYKLKLIESSTFNTLIKAYCKHNKFEYFELIIYDNSPTKQNINMRIPLQTQYIHDSSNGGLYAAYTYALNRAIKTRCDWILLLDQDTKLPLNYFFSVNKITADKSLDDDVVAIVPKVFTINGKMISPCKLYIGIIGKAVALEYIGICNFKISAINSGAFIKVEFLKAIGGFNPLFKLDFVDHWIFYKIFTCRKKVFILDSIMEHELSVTNYNMYMSKERYKNILNSEILFINLYSPKLEKMVYILKLIIRSFKQLIFIKNKNYFYITCIAITNIVIGKNKC
ncbi:MAG: glycosyl transferase family 2 [Actinobacteria bacterium]|nr:glycosyl transferase family 2 [Actinomycetota bacterium]